MDRQRLKAATASVALQAGLLYALMVGLNIDVASIPSDVLNVYDISPDPPPPPPTEEAIPERAMTDKEEGAAAPPSLRAAPTPIVTPPPRIQIAVQPRIVASPVTSPVTGSDRGVGVSDRAGSGTGTGGIGSGTGSGGAGMGDGGGMASRARRIRGALSFARDYPRAARAIRAEGTVFVRIDIAADGRVDDCSVTRSSGNRDLDYTTCGLIIDRFRYAPARDASGRPVVTSESTSFDWRLRD